MTRLGGLAPVALVALVGLVGLGCGGSAELPGPSAGTRTVEVTRGDLADRVLLTGALRAGSTIDVSVPKTDAWQLTIRWMAEDGVLVKAGERVLEFDNSMFTSGLEQKRIAATEARTTYQSLREVSALAIAVKEHELEQHRIALAKATLLASVPADLLPQRTAQERLLEQARAETAVARAEKELAAEKQAAALEQQVKQIELAKATRTVEAAERSIAELVLTAPRDGVLMIGDHPWEGRTYRVGDTVQPGMRLLSMPEAGVPMIVHAELSDVDDGRIATGMTGTCTLDAYPREPLSCTVTELAPVAGTRDPGSLRRAFAVTLTLATTDQDRMRPGMSVKVELVGPGPRAALLAPRGAVVFVDSPLLRLAGGARRPVKLGPCDAQRCVIEDGAAEGDAVEVGAR